MNVEVQNASFSYSSYGKEMVFRNISFKLKSGDILGILGPNGVGKSTLLKCINGILVLKDGNIRLNGKSIREKKLKEIGATIGYVPQNDGTTFPFKVYEMVLMGRAAHINIFGTPSKRDIIMAKQAVSIVGIEGLIDKIYSELSGGEAKLVMIARALASEPELLILDEPTSHLDIKNQMKVMYILKQLTKKKRLTIIFTTHLPDNALLFSDRVLMMKKHDKAIYGFPEAVMTEKNILAAFGVEVKIITAIKTKPAIKTVVPYWSKEIFKF